jgi:hypothetical protein
MARLGRVLVEAIVLHYGREEVLRRLSHPFWFQSLGAVMGMDWHSSGITTSVLGALKRGLSPVEWELGLHVCGGRGKHSRRTPDELAKVGERTGLDADGLARASRLVAKVDSAAVQDGFDLYLHGFIVTDDGAWTVVQQGMNAASRQARRYHWLSERVSSFVDEPHAAILGEPRGAIINLCDRRAAQSRESQLEIVRAGPDLAVRELSRMRSPSPSPSPRARELPHLCLPAHHDVTAGDVVLRRLHGALAAAADRGPRDFADLLLTPGVGARTVFALASVAEVLHGAPCRFSDPARFSFAHGGKDGHPFPVPLRVYDETLRVMRDAVERAKLGMDDRLSALQKLASEARRLESAWRGPPFEQIVETERASSFAYGGMTVSGPARPPPRRRERNPQLDLPGIA